MLAAAAVLLLAGAPDAGVGVGVGFKWEYPPQTLHEIPIDGTTYVDGVPVRLRQLLVVGRPDEIGKHFFDSFTRQGLYIAPRQAIDRLLTGVDPQAIITYSVVLQPNGPNHTTVILGESRPIDRKVAPAAGLPVMPQAKGVIPVQFEGYAQLSYPVTATEAEVRAFYAKELGARGYQKKEGNAWERAGDRVELAVSPGATGQVKVVVRQTASAISSGNRESR